MRHSVALIAAAFLGSVLPVCAQQEKESGGPAVYKVEFNLRNGSDGAVKSSQHYTMLIDESRKGLFQAGNRVPVATGSPQHTYIDDGVNIECILHESNGKAALQGGIELSSIVPHESMPEPVIRQRKLSFNTTLELGMPTVIIDERKMLAATPASIANSAPTSAIPATPLAIGQVEVTVTKVK
ncbi:MAG: hypothetical protein ACR2NN_19920 [Bryobacteraceae bacterium]